MKTLKTRIMSLILVLVTMLTLLPTAAFAASSTGTGIKPTSNTNYWTTRLLHDGTPYSYKPPMVAGKMLYCMDRGYGYRWGTDSFLNSYTYTSATGADADAVLKTALAESGLGELDAQQLENFKWMMTFIVDYKGDIPGSLFMAAQTYVWDHQTFKGEGDGDIDAGGFANADTYETYCGYIDWMLAQKAKEDAEFQQQIEGYAEKGITAAVVEDESSKWAVFALSSSRKNQSFFNCYAPRKLAVSSTPLPEEPDSPVAGDADITLKKVAAGTTKGLDGAKFNIYLDGQIVGSDVTQNGGIIEVSDVTEGLWSFVEVEAPSGYSNLMTEAENCRLRYAIQAVSLDCIHLYLMESYACVKHHFCLTLKQCLDLVKEIRKTLKVFRQNERLAVEKNNRRTALEGGTSETLFTGDGNTGSAAARDSKRSDYEQSQGYGYTHSGKLQHSRMTKLGTSAQMEEIRVGQCDQITGEAASTSRLTGKHLLY